MKVALTGANGFLGGHLVSAFQEYGFKVIALVRPSANISSIEKHSNVQIEEIDYSKDLINEFCRLKDKYGFIDLFVHNAGVTVSLNPQEYYDINTLLTKKIIGSLEKIEWLYPSGKLVYISSLTVQGPIGINHPVSHYGRSKMEAERFFIKSKYNHLIIRPTAIYGAGDYAFLPLFKGAKSRLYPLTNKNQKMSMIHGKDLAHLVHSEAIKSTGILHASDKKTYMHSDFIETLSSVFKKNIYFFPVPHTISKFILGLSDIWHKLIGKRPSITKEKFLEISQDWNHHEYDEIKYSETECPTSLKNGFKDAFDFYKSKKLI